MLSAKKDEAENFFFSVEYAHSAEAGSLSWPLVQTAECGGNVHSGKPHPLQL